MVLKKDTKVWDALLKNIATLTKSESEAGFYSDQGHPNSEDSLAQIATLNNFGGENPDPTRGDIPARPFMTFSVQNAERTVGRKMAKGLEGLLKSGNVFNALDLPAAELQKWIGWTIEMEELYTPNAPATISKKGRDEPLSDSGYLAENVERKVKIGGK